MAFYYIQLYTIYKFLSGGLWNEGILERGTDGVHRHRRLAGVLPGRCDGLLIALVVFAVADYITGLMCAVVDKNLSSAVGFRGICRKVLIFILVGIANILDVQIIGTGSILRTAVIFFYLSNEGVSLLENAAYLGLPIPQKLKEVLKQIHDRAENDDNENDNDSNEKEDQ